MTMSSKYTICPTFFLQKFGCFPPSLKLQENPWRKVGFNHLLEFKKLAFKTQL